MKFKLFLLLVFVFFIPNMTIHATTLTQSASVADLLNNESNEQNVNDSNIESPNSETEEIIEEDVAFQSDRSLFLDFIKMIVALVVVLGLIYYLLKFIQKRSRIYQQSRSLENLGGLSLGANKSIQIIRVGNEYYLIGVGDDVQLLTKIDNRETLEDLLKNEAQSTETSSFQNILKSFQNRNKNPYRQEELNNNIKSEFETMKSMRDRVMNRYQNKDERKDD